MRLLRLSLILPGLQFILLSGALLYDHHFYQKHLLGEQAAEMDLPRGLETEGGLMFVGHYEPSCFLDFVISMNLPVFLIGMMPLYLIFENIQGGLSEFIFYSAGSILVICLWHVVGRWFDHRLGSEKRKFAALNPGIGFKILIWSCLILALMVLAAITVAIILEGIGSFFYPRLFWAFTWSGFASAVLADKIYRWHREAHRQVA